MKNNGISIEKVNFSYSKSQELKNINLFIPKGSFTGITGINGSGKSTFLYLLNGLIPHQVVGSFFGNVFVDGVNTREKPVSFFSRKVGMVFQNPDFMIFNLTVYDEVAFGLINLGYKNIEDRVVSALKLVGLNGYEKRDPNTLSLGQKQKMCLAVVMAMDTDYIVLDEPSAMLDYVSGIYLYELLKSVNIAGKTIIIVEHDTDLLYSFAHDVIVLDKGTVALHGKTRQVFNQKNKLKKLGIKIPQKA